MRSFCIIDMLTEKWNKGSYLSANLRGGGEKSVLGWHIDLGGGGRGEGDDGGAPDNYPTQSQILYVRLTKLTSNFSNSS